MRKFDPIRIQKKEVDGCVQRLCVGKDLQNAIRGGEGKKGSLHMDTEKKRKEGDEVGFITPSKKN